MYREIKEEREEQDEKFFAEKVKIATTAEDDMDDVYVTKPNSANPQNRELVDYWKPGVHGDGSVRYPTRGDVAALLELDTGETWLIF